ncbi:hypothetical protein VMCG_09333 [Cytospora schulzeri]|uniref:Rhodopsin domain-containing protein n=1 Tax=Cytospora schulzeri TaxID=448051 RepID=A0A423VJR4_9PEZI|nr:hypothetical protein VMCG_09333 [Valsa malicola]
MFIPRRSAGASSAPLLEPPGISYDTFLGVIWAGAALSLIFVIFRLYSRFRGPGRLYWDDAFVIFAEVLVLTSAGLWQWGAKFMYYVLEVKSGLAAPGPELIPEMWKFLDVTLAMELFFYTSLILVKLSFLFFFRRLGQNVQRQRYIWWFVLIFCLVVYAISLGDMEYSCYKGSLEVIEGYCTSHAANDFTVASLFSASAAKKKPVWTPTDTYYQRLRSRMKTDNKKKDTLYDLSAISLPGEPEPVPTFNKANISFPESGCDTTRGATSNDSHPPVLLPSPSLQRQVIVCSGGLSDHDTIAPQGNQIRRQMEYRVTQHETPPYMQVPQYQWAQGAEWQKHRRITASSFNDQNNVVVWSEAVTVAHDVLRYWTSKPSIRTAADDLRTLSLHIMSKAGFGKSFKFQGHDERKAAAAADLSLTYKESLQIILENCILVFALGTKFLAKPWLPKKLRRIHDACTSFQNYMIQVYEEEKRAYLQGQSADRNFMTSLVRASQDEATNSSLGGLTESEIYGNMFTFNFAGHDTTAHTFTFALYFLAANPDTQDWVSEEIRHVMGDREPHEWLYSDYPRLKRCLAVMYETLRLYTPVPTSKFVDGETSQPLTVGDKTLVLPPGTMIVPSYASLQTDPKYWGDDSLEWRPSRFIKSTNPTTGTTGNPLDNEEFMTLDRGTYLAWSGGARDCVGRKFSQVEFVAVMASLFRDWRVGPVLADGESPESARKRVLELIEMDSAPVLLLQMLHPERCPLVWSRR